MQLTSLFSAMKRNLTQSYQFLLVGFSFSFLLLMVFTSLAGLPEGMVGALYSLLVPLFYYFVALLLVTLLIPVFIAKYSVWLLVVAKTAFDMFLIGDFFLFRVYRFHADLMFFNMLLNDFKGVGISIYMVLLSIFVVAMLFFINVWLLKKAKTWFDNTQRPLLLKVNLTLVGLFVIGQLIHIVGHEYKTNGIIKYTPYLPYYAPITSGSLMAKLQTKYPGVFPEPDRQQDQVSSLVNDRANGLFNYPQAPLQCAPENKPNILLFVAESWRQDSLTSDITPNIYQFAQQPSSTQFSNHLSGGSVTVNGMFSLFHGLHPTYRQYAEMEPMKHRAVMIKALEQQGYDISVYTSSNLEPFSLKTMMVGDLNGDKFINPMSGPVAENDATVIQAVIEDINRNEQKIAKGQSVKPWFKLVFVTSSHHSYNYPKELEKFTPIETNPERFVFNPGMDPAPLFNRYKNSVHYIDSLFGQLWATLSDSSQAANTFTVVTSDHGEEFDDNKIGFWGHGNNFSQSQVAVPFVMHLGEQVKNALPYKNTGEFSSEGNAKQNAKQNTEHKVERLTGHVDFVPTVMKDLLQCQNPVSDYTSGYSLLSSQEQHQGMVVSSYIDTAYIMDGWVYSTNIALGNYRFADMQKDGLKVNFKKLNELKIKSTTMLNR